MLTMLSSSSSSTALRVEEGEMGMHEKEVTVAASGPKDRYNLAYTIHFLLGIANLLPWNAFITAVDYFTHLYPRNHVDKTFAVVYMSSSLAVLVILLATTNWVGRPSVRCRINAGLSLFIASLLLIPLLDTFNVLRGGGEGHHVGSYAIIVSAVMVCGLADGLVGGSLVGSTGELPERYMQAVFAGTALSGVLISVLRIITKASLSQNAKGLRRSTHIYFIASITIMLGCVASYNMLDKLPVMKYHRRKRPPTSEQFESMYLNNQPTNSKSEITSADSTGQQKFWNVWKRIQWPTFAVFAIYLVTLSIFPGFITEDVSSRLFKDWYPILLISSYNVFDLIGKTLTAAYIPNGTKWSLWGCLARFLFYPLFAACLHGPHFLRTETPMIILTCLLGVTNGYLTSVLMILAPKSVPLEEAETAGIVMVTFLNMGLVGGSVLGWLWVI